MFGYGNHRRPQIRYHRGSIPGDSDFRSLGLNGGSHEPGDICAGVESFAGSPDHIQDRYKNEFVKIYKTWIYMKTPPAGGAQELDLKEDLRDALEVLDDFFFAGCLTRSFLRELEVQRNVFAYGQPGHQVYLGIGAPGLTGAASIWEGWTTIYIDTLEDGCPRTVKSMFETLVHEIAHAVFQQFACACANCKRMLGQHGHGDMWVRMANFMKMTIQQWDLDLADFYNTGDIERHNRDFN